MKRLGCTIASLCFAVPCIGGAGWRRIRDAANALVLAVGVVFAALPPAHAQTAKRPNIVFVLFDDAGFSDFGAYGSEIETPNIDAIAAAGVRMTNFHTPSTCESSRAMLHSGVDHHRAGMGTLQPVIAESQKGKPGYEGYLSDQVHSIGRLMRDGGYATYFSGKWNLGTGIDRAPGRYGWDRYVALEQTGADNFEAKVYAPLSLESVWWEDGKRLSLPPDFFSSRFYVDRLIRYIDEGRGAGKPFFGILSLQAVHSPLQAPQADIEKYARRYEAGWDAIREERYQRQVGMGLFKPGLRMLASTGTSEWSKVPEEQRRDYARKMAVFAAMLDNADREIGRLKDHLRSIGELDNTAFIVMSDNGADAFDLSTINPLFRLWYRFHYALDRERMGGRGSYVHYGADWARVSNTPLTSFKGSASEGGLRVPFIISYPPRVSPATSDAFAFASDFLPTVLDLAGIAMPGEIYNGRKLHRPVGSSMMPHLEGKSAVIHPKERMFGFEGTGSKAVYKDGYKLVWDFDPEIPSRWKLFRIDEDPTEANDLSEREPERLTAMLAEMSRYESENGVVAPEPGYDPFRQLLRNNYGVLARQLGPVLAPILLILLAIVAAPIVVWRYRRRRS
ncbi:MAG TPA: arylsulfatase [Beijerinckiaceae bacterium]|nr:arylsulfatase [Beijerinckiaceae bacterium]